MKHTAPILIALLLPLLAGCVTSSDLQRLESAQLDYQREVDGSLDKLRDGTVTHDEAKEEIAEARATLLAEIEATAKEVEARTTAVAKAATEGPITGHPLIDLGLSSLIGAFGANTYRNQKRKARNEPV